MSGVLINSIRPGDWVTIEVEVFDTDPGDEDNTICATVGRDNIWLNNGQIIGHWRKPQAQGGQADDAG